MSDASTSGPGRESISDRLRSINERTSAQLASSIDEDASRRPRGRFGMLGSAFVAFSRAWFSSEGIGNGKRGYIHAWSAGLETIMTGAKRWEYELRRVEGRGAFPPSTPEDVRKANAKYVSSGGS